MSKRNPISAALDALGSSAIRAFCLALALMAVPGPAGAADKLVLQLHREPQFEFAGYYAALWQGFYRETGLEVEIKPGSPEGTPPTDPVREITEGRAQFGTGTIQLLIRAAQGHSLLLLAPIFQQSGAAVYYRADGDFSSPGALLNGRVGRLPASNILELELRTALYSEGIDPDKLRFLPIEPGQAIADLASHRVDAAVGSAWELPWQARERGVALKSFNPAGYRTQFYGDSLFTLQRLAKADPTMVLRFREASIQGWGYALQHPDEIAARILAELPVLVPVSDPAGFGRYQTEVARRLARYPGVPLGHSNPERWGRIQQSLIEIGAISRPADLAAFLYDPSTAASNRTDWQAPILALAVAVALLVGAGFLWRWGHRRNAAPVGAAGAAGDRKPLDNGLTQTAAAVTRTSRRLADWVVASLEKFRRYTRVQSRLARVRAAASVAPNRLRTLAPRISQRLARLRGAASGVSSRLKTLARMMRLRSQLARLRAAASGALSRLLSPTRRVAASTGGAAPGPRPTDLNAILTSLERSIRRRVPRSVICRFSLLPESWLGHTDPDAVATAILDLVAAAVADMPAGGDLIVGTRQYTIDDAAAAEFAGSVPGDYVRLTVKDNGPGLFPERLDRIFEPEVTARPAVAAAEIMTRRLGGFARVESAEGIGTAVHLYFRRAGVAAGESVQQPPEDDQRAAAA